MPRRARRHDDQSAAMEDDAARKGSRPASDESPAGNQDNTPLSAAKPSQKTRSSKSAKQSAEDHPVAEPAAATRKPRVRKPVVAAEAAPEVAAVDSTPAETPRRSTRSRSARSKTDPSTSAGSAESTSEAQSGATPSGEASTARPRRRIGGRRTAAEAAVPIPGLDTDVAQSDERSAAGDPPDGGAAPSSSRSRRSRRGGRRRRGASETAAGGVDAVAGEESEQVDEAPEPIAAAVETDDGSGDKRSRRSRRGGRRRGKGVGDEVDGVAESEPGSKAEEVSALSLPAPHVREHWSAPLLVPSIEDIGLSPVDLGVEASVDTNDPAFLINGREHAAHLFFVNAEAAHANDGEGGDPSSVERQIRRAAAAGIHLHTCVAYLPLKNALGERSFGSMDADMQAIVDADPEAMIVLRVQCVPTNFWARTHASQMVRYQDGTEGDVSIASAEFWADCVDALRAILERIADPSSPGHGRVFALHLDKGEWFYEPGAGYDYSEPNLIAFRSWLRENYQTSYAHRAAWFDGSVTFDNAEIPAYDPAREKRADTVIYDRKRDRRFVDYLSYASSVVGSVLCGLGKAVKSISGGKLLVFVPYGYLYEFAARNDSGHQALGQVLGCDGIDVLTGPNSYLSRAAGGVGGFASPVDSVSLHGKLWVVEDDTKSYLATDDSPDTYNPRIPSQQETVMVHRRNYLAALAHGCGMTWMDLWGQGWLDSDSIWEELIDLIELGSRLRAEPRSVAAPEAAMVVDEASYAWVRGDSGGQQIQSGMILKARDLLLRSGASVGLYLQSDVASLPDSVKVVIFANALRVTSEQRQAIRDRLQTAGKTLVWLYAPGLFDETGATPSEVTEIVGMPLKAQPWNARIGTIFTDERNVIIERLHGGKRMGTEDVVNPSFAAIDPQAAVLGEYSLSGNASIAVKEMEGGWNSIFVGEPHLTGELIRGIFRYAGAHLYDVQDDIVFARDDGFLMIHAPYTGQRVIHLPRAAACYSVFERRLLAQNSSSIRSFMRGRSTHLFLWGSLESLSARTRLSIDDLLATLAQQRPVRGSRGPQDGPAEFDAVIELEHDGEYVLEERDEDVAPSEPVARRRGAAEHPRRGGQVSTPGLDLQPEALDRARQEASHITEQVLSELSVDLTETEEGAESLDFDAGDSETGELPQADAPGASRSSSRRRRWRRRQQADSPQNSAAGAPVSVDDIIGDLVARRHKPEQGQGGEDA